MRYINCTKDELVRFAKNRGLKLRTNAKRTEYAKALKKADQTLRFRFLDLPPEMRNKIYNELLIYEEYVGLPPSDSCDLSTNQQGGIFGPVSRQHHYGRSE